MTTTSLISVETKAAVSCSEMARMVGLSRQRFAQLQGTTFPWPLYDVATRRPFYPEDLQKVCLEVRRRNWGIDNRPVLFYAPRIPSPSAPTARKPKRVAMKRNKDIAALLDGLNGLGLTTATAAEVESVTGELYPQGSAGIDQGEVLRRVFLHIRSNNSAEKVVRKE
jgi:hypothetical protein